MSNLKINYRGIIGLTILYFVIFCILVYWRLKSNALVPEYSITDLSNLPSFLNNVRTGDLMYSTYNSIYGKVSKLVTGCDWSHVALILDGCVVEVAVYPEEDETKEEQYDGLCVIPLKEWLKLNDGRIIGFQRGVPIDEQQFRYVLNEYKDIKLDLNLYNWRKVVFKDRDCVQRSVQKYYFCSQIIAELLQKLTNLNFKWSADSYSPLSISELIGNKVHVINLEQINTL